MSIELPAALRAQARGLLAAEAAAELLIGHRTWLRRTDFTGRFVHLGHDLLSTTMAAVDWHATITALQAGHLPCSGSEQRILRLAASLAEGIPVDLRDTLTSLDETNIDLVTVAVRHAGGRRRYG